MRAPKLLLIPLLALAALFAFGCQPEAGTGDASDSCEALCDEYSECSIDGFDDEVCAAICEVVGDLEDEVSDGCEEAVVDLFECGEGLTCEEIESFDFHDLDDLDDLDDFDDLGDFIDDVADGLIDDECEEEAEEVEDECDDDDDDD